MGSSQFVGPGGALIVSFIAFTIVFVVLAGLTAVIYAIKFFAGDGNKSDKGQGSPAGAPKAVSSPSVPAGGGGKIAAVITGAILAATQGRGRILSIVPASAAGAVSPTARTTWKTTGIVERVSGRLVRTWKQ